MWPLLTREYYDFDKFEYTLSEVAVTQVTSFLGNFFQKKKTFLYTLLCKNSSHDCGLTYTIMIEQIIFYPTCGCFSISISFSGRLVSEKFFSEYSSAKKLAQLWPHLISGDHDLNKHKSTLSENAFNKIADGIALAYQQQRLLQEYEYKFYQDTLL